MNCQQIFGVEFDGHLQLGSRYKMPQCESAERRLHTLMSHLNASDIESSDLALAAGSTDGGLTRQDTAALAVRSLPRFDVGVMEAYLDDLRSMKLEVYELLRQHPELLPPTLEGMTKGALNSGRRDIPSPPSPPLPPLSPLAPSIWFHAILTPINSVLHV